MFSHDELQFTPIGGEEESGGVGQEFANGTKKIEMSFVAKVNGEEAVLVYTVNTYGWGPRIKEGLLMWRSLFFNVTGPAEQLTGLALLSHASTVLAEEVQLAELEEL